MGIQVSNSSAGNPLVTLFGRLPDEHFTAAVMHEEEVPYAKLWPGAIEQKMVYIVPDQDQLTQILHALDEQRLDYQQLQDYGGLDGGCSTLPI